MFLTRYDYLRIENDKKQVVGTYCGQKTGKNVFATGVQISITFHSDSAGVKSGFDIHFTAVPHGNWFFCGFPMFEVLG